MPAITATTLLFALWLTCGLTAGLTLGIGLAWRDGRVTTGGLGLLLGDALLILAGLSS